mmetsp:Transcript_32289/g.89189  ORF Transcript_32289/g.89189 Transcript_32289/m.89189 type:complete len:206 (+) Transcript_32289:834-1451(+)
MLRDCLAEEAILRIKGETLQSEPQYAIELKLAEGIRGHGVRKDKPCPRAGVVQISQANRLADEVAFDLSCAISDRDPVLLLIVEFHHVSVVVEVLSRRRHAAIEELLCPASVADTRGGGHEEVCGPGVENDREALGRRRADGDLPEVGRFVHHGTTLPDHGHVLLVKRNGDSRRAQEWYAHDERQPAHGESDVAHRRHAETRVEG